MIQHAGALLGKHRGLPALVLGNSPWRSGFPVGAWAGITIGCNAIYREGYDLDYIVTVDRQITKEVAKWAPWDRGVTMVISQRPNWPGDITPGPNVYTAQPDHNDNWPGLVWAKKAGSLALALAKCLGCPQIVMAGFSLDGTNEYIGTDCYSHRQPGAGKQIAGSDKGSVSPISQRINDLDSEGYKVFWVAPAPAMLELLQRPAVGRKQS